jgi:hypothetical protein
MSVTLWWRPTEIVYEISSGFDVWIPGCPLGGRE